MVHAGGEAQAAYLTGIALAARDGGTPPVTPRSEASTSGASVVSNGSWVDLTDHRGTAADSPRSP